MIGGNPDLISAQEFFERQSTAFQNEAFGVTKAKLFRKGGLKIDRFVNRAGDELNLSELAASDRNAFINAGLNPDDF